MKYLVVLILLAAVAGLVYWRLRPYILMARRILGVVREANRVGAGRARQDSAAGQVRRGPDEKLVRCASCGTWMPGSRAVRLPGANSTYCSHACLERSAAAPRGARKSAS